MDRWTALTLGLIKQNTRCDFDTLVMLANSHNELRQFLGHSDLWDKALYARRTVIDNVNKFTPELLDAINVEIVKCGHKLQGKTPETPLIARTDSFVVENNARWPTDMSLLMDAVRAGVKLGAKELQKAGLPGWQKSETDTAPVKAAFNLVRKVGSASEDDVKAYLEICKPFVAWMERTAVLLASRGSELEPIKIKPNKIATLEHFIRCARILLDQIRRRVVEGETIPHHEKFFSVFLFYTRWISKGKAGCIAELGAPATVAQDQYGFVVASIVNWTGGDTDYAVPIVAEVQKHFLLDAMTFDQGFHSPANRAKLDEMLKHNVLPKKGRLNDAERARETAPEFVKMKNWHSGIESCINNLERRGLDKVYSRGAEGFERTVKLAVLAMNVHRIGLLELRRLREERRRDKERMRRKLRVA